MLDRDAFTCAQGKTFNGKSSKQGGRTKLANLATKAGVEGRQRLKIHTPLIQIAKADIPGRETRSWSNTRGHEADDLCLGLGPLKSGEVAAHCESGYRCSSGAMAVLVPPLISARLSFFERSPSGPNVERSWIRDSNLS